MVSLNAPLSLHAVRAGKKWDMMRWREGSRDSFSVCVVDIQSSAPTAYSLYAVDEEIEDNEM